MANSLTVPTANTWLLRFFFGVVLMELFLGGGGRLIDVGILSPRMYLFFLSMGLALLILFVYPFLSRSVLILTAAFTFLLVMSSILGLFRGLSVSEIFASDIKPLLFFYIILFLDINIRNISGVHQVSRLIRTAAFILALLYLPIFVLLNAKVINFQWLWQITYDTEEFFFRDDVAFLYKGFVYLAIGFFFLLRSPYPGHQWMKRIIVLALFLTLTRGFIVAWALVYVVYLLLFGRKKILVFILVAAIPVMALYYWQFVNQYLSDKMESDNKRIEQIQEVFEMLTPASILWGHGYGVGTANVEMHFEIVYLEILHKQGLVGLSFWIFLFLGISFLFAKAVQQGNLEWALPYWLATLFIYVESFTNPFILSPLGMVVPLISWVCLRVLSKKDYGSIRMYGYA